MYPYLETFVLVLSDTIDRKILQGFRDIQSRPLSCQVSCQTDIKFQVRYVQLVGIFKAVFLIMIKC